MCLWIYRDTLVIHVAGVLVTIGVSGCGYMGALVCEIVLAGAGVLLGVLVRVQGVFVGVGVLACVCGYIHLHVGLYSFYILYA